jgi:predicted nucleic acid-binding protein
MIVSDTNLLVYLFVEGEYTEVAEEVLRKDSDWIVPNLWKHEFLSAVATLINNDEIEKNDAISILDEAESHFEDQVFPVSSRQVIELCENSGLSSYDCEFVALAMVMEIPLVTSDQEILQEYPGIANSPQDYLKQAD